MVAPQNKNIPTLTDVIVPDERRVDAVLGARERNERDIEAVIAELQTRLAARTFALTEALMRTAFSEMEAKIYEQISAELRRQLPEIIDSLIREYLAPDQER
jgi:hypothetical protein